MKLISYNVNGIRAALKKGLAEWLAGEDIDIVAIQETKAMIEQVDLSELEALGYTAYFHSAEKKGYSGVALLCKQQPDMVNVGTGIDWIDIEGRVIRADFGDLTLVNAYFPSGTSGEERQAIKYKFLDAMYDWIEELKAKRPNLILVGDYNIAHTEIDIHNPKSNKKTSGFLPEERAWMTKWFESGMIDAYRHLNPEEQTYSWWSYRAGARAKDKGWRIDYASVSEPLRDSLVNCTHRKDAVHSDHCPVFLELDL